MWHRADEIHFRGSSRLVAVTWDGGTHIRRKYVGMWCSVVVRMIWDKFLETVTKASRPLGVAKRRFFEVVAHLESIKLANCHRTYDYEVPGIV